MSQYSQCDMFKKCWLESIWQDVDIVCFWRRADIFLFTSCSFDSVSFSCYWHVRIVCKTSLSRHPVQQLKNSLPSMKRLIICCCLHSSRLLSQRRQCCHNRICDYFLLVGFLFYICFWKDFCSCLHGHWKNVYIRVRILKFSDTVVISLY